jgi:hypothetical protein
LVFAEQLLIIAITKTTGDNFGPTLGGNAMRAACDYKTHNKNGINFQQTYSR